MEEIIIKSAYIKFIPEVIEWFLTDYCQPEPYFSEIRIHLQRILDEYYKNSRSYQNGEKHFFLERRYVYDLREAVYQAITDKLNDEDLLSEFYEFLNEEYNKRR